MIPGYPPELGGRNCTPVQTLIYLETMAGRRIPRSGHFPGYAIVTPSLLEFGNDAQQALAPAAIRGDTIWCIGMSEPNAGSDLAGLQTRAEVFDDEFVVNGQKVWTSYAQIAQKCFCYVRTDPTVAKHRGISLLIIDMDTPGIEVRPLTPHHPQGRLRRGVLHRRARPAREPRRPAQRRLGDHAGLARARACRPLGRRRRPLRADRRRARRARAPHRPQRPIRSCAARSPRRYELASSLRSLGYQGFASFAQGSSAPEHSYMKMATSEAGKAAFELGMEICGPYGAVTDELSGQEAGRWVTSFFVTLRQHDGGRLVRDPTQHHRPARAGPAPGLIRHPWTSPSPTTSNCSATPRASSSTASARPRSCARTSTTPPRTNRCGRTCSEYTALGLGPATDLCLFLEETG